MKKLIFIILVLCICAKVFSQTYFNNNYDYNQEVNSATSLINNDSSGFMIAAHIITTDYHALNLININDIGDTILSKIYYTDSLDVFYAGISGAIIKTVDTCYMLAGSFEIDSSTTTQYGDGILLKIDQDGDTLWSRKYGGVYFDAFRMCRQTNDGGFIAVGEKDKYNNGWSDMWLVKTDSLGNMEWEKTYGEVSKFESALAVEQTHDEGYIISGTKGYLNYNHYIIKTDSLGNQQWFKYFNTGNDDGSCYIVQSLDSGFIITGGIVITGMSKQGCIRKLDKNGNQVWLKNYGDITYDFLDTRAVELDDGSIVVAGTSIYPVERGWLIKVSSNGDLLWDRTYFFDTLRPCYFYDLVKAQDNGFAMCAWTQTDHGQDAWVVKVDEDGCEYVNCEVGLSNPVYIENLELLMYPNPASETINFETNYNGNYNNTKLIISDMLGRIIKEYNVDKSILTINSNDLQNGIYYAFIVVDKVVVNKQKFAILK
ncbi:MAG: hypothetical protein A2046_17205 [Bacteroidetes bacterium GWA2_30_7]|nr:MAG: hypothetical protein A2046_17205 [Bacteroidetes bacterium GWA2_30_7]